MGYFSLDVGLEIIELRFNGGAILDYGVDGPYNVLVNIGDMYVWHDSEVYTTNAYDCSNFESPLYAEHAPILIDGNDDFTPENGVTGGSGTELDPYVIEGWEIDTSVAGSYGSQVCVEILNTDAHFIIRNMYVHLDESDDYGIGFFFWDVANGLSLIHI